MRDIFETRTFPPHTSGIIRNNRISILWQRWSVIIFYSKTVSKKLVSWLLYKKSSNIIRVNLLSHKVNSPSVSINFLGIVLLKYTPQNLIFICKVDKLYFIGYTIVKGGVKNHYVYSWTCVTSFLQVNWYLYRVASSIFCN